MRTKTIKVITAVAFFIMVSAGAAFAAKCPQWLPSNLCDSGGNLLLDPNSIIRMALYLIIIAGILWTLWNIIAAGFSWASSGGDEEKRGKATKKIIAALVGLLIIVVSFTIMSIVASMVGFNVQQTTVGIPCITEEGEAGFWLPEYDLDNDGQIDKNECRVFDN